MGIWSRTYVCCAIPLYNSGIYLIMVQFAVVALVTGILSFSAPHIVAVSIPAIAPIIFGIVCILVATAQGVGFLGVYREKPNLFKLYARVNAGLVALALVLAVIFIGVSAGNHKAALAKCITLFTTQANMNGTTTSTISGTKFQNASVSTGTKICDVWTWVQLGIMGLLFIIVALTEAYFLMYQNIYASEQRLDHARYDSVYSTAAEEIRQSGLWESTSLANGGGGGASSLGHGRASSELSRPQLYSDNVRAPSAGSGLRNEIGMEGENEKYAGDGRFTPPVNSNYGYDNVGNGSNSSNGFYSTPQQQQQQQVSPTKRGMNSSIPVGGVYNSSGNYQPSVTGSNNGSNSGGGERSASKMSNRSQFNQQQPQTTNTYSSTPSSSSYIPHSQSSYAQQQPASASPLSLLGYQDPYGGVSNSPLIHQPQHQPQQSTSTTGGGGRRTPTENNYGGARSNSNSRMGNNTPTNNYNNNNQTRTSSDIGGGYQGGYGQVQNVQQQSQQEYRGNSPSRKQLPRQPSDRGQQQQDGYY